MTIKKNPKSNTWEFQISLGTDPITNKRIVTRRRGFKTKKEAEQEYNKLKISEYNQPKASAHIISFAELYQVYLKEIYQTKNILYVRSIEYACQNHVLPYFDNVVNIQKITRKHILEYQKHLQQSKLSNNTINKIMLYLSAIFKVACDSDYLTKSPYFNVPRLTLQKKKMQFFTPQQFKQYSNCIQSDELIFKAFFTLAYFSGARASELLALTWGDIQNDIMTINKTFHYSKKEYHIKETKNKTSNRNITLDKNTLSILMAWKSEQAELLNQSESTFIFIDYTDYPSRHRFYHKIETICKRAKLEPIRLHDFRHSHVALLIDLKEDPFIIKERMGHANISTTYDIYGHLFPNRQKELADKLANI